MVDIEVLRELHALSSVFEQRWGKEVDYAGMPATVSEKRLLLALRYAVETGDSILVSLQMIQDIMREYHDYLESHPAMHKRGGKNGYIFDRACPLCGSKVKYIEGGSSYAYACETKHCFYSACRGV